MTAAFHYNVKAKVIRYKTADKIDFMEFEQRFKHENPIKAREEAFSFYQNYLDVLLEAQGKRYESDLQAREDLQSFIDTGTSTKINIGEKDIELSDSYGNGIGIFFVIDNPKTENYEDLKDNVDDEWLIHSIGLNGWPGDHQALMDGLNKEYSYYQYYGYDTKNYKTTVDFYESDIDETEANIILTTPFDWTGYEKPNTEKEQREQINRFILPDSFEQIINQGEGNQVEFKPSLLYNFKTNAAGIGVKAIIAKSLCAFLNSNGGFLFIGITDKGEVQGLSFDFSLSNGKNPKDYFQLEFDQMIEHFLSTSIMSNISGQFIKIAEKEIFVVAVQPSKRKPIFVKEKSGKAFYIRKLASSKQISDIEEIVNYCIDHWGN